jgi:transcription elongation factor Spt5
MGLFDDLAKKPQVPPPAEKPTERPAVVARVSIDMKEEKMDMTAGVGREFPAVVMNSGTEDDTVRIKVDMIYGYESPDPPEWTVKLTGLVEKVWEIGTYVKNHQEVKTRKEFIDRQVKELVDKGQPVPDDLAKERDSLVEKFREAEEGLSRSFILVSGGRRELTLSVTCPKGARYGDSLNVVVNAISKSDPAARDHKSSVFMARQSVLAVKTSIGHERSVADSLYSKAKARDIGVFSILAPANLRGYLFIESMNPDRLEEAVRGIRRAHGVVGRGKGETKGDEGIIAIKDMDIYLAPKPIVSGIMEGDIVELISGPFKGEKARVLRIDEAKEEITVELFEAMVPIPVTVRGDAVRVLQKEQELK